MAADPADRYASVGELAAALRAPDLSVPPMPDDSATRQFGPRPPGAAAPRQRRWPWLVAATIALVLLAIVAATVTGASGERREHGACGPPATPRKTNSEDATVEVAVVHADVDGDGCDEPLVRTGNVLEWNGLRFSVGEPGDVVLVGDWDCDGVATAAAWRTADGVAFVFDGWADAGEELPATRRVSLRPGGGPPTPCRG